MNYDIVQTPQTSFVYIKKYDLILTITLEINAKSTSKVHCGHTVGGSAVSSYI